MADTVDRFDLLELDIDLRMTALWKEMSETFSDEWLQAIAPFVRAAYGKGYQDALVEDTKEDRGRLHQDHGYKVP